MKYFFLVVLCFASSLMAADKTRIAVMGFVAKPGVDPNTASTVSELLSGELVALKKFDVIDRANLDKIMREQALQQSGCSDQACAVKLGNILNVQKLVVGSVSRLGSKTIITLNFIDVERSRIEISDNETASSEDEIILRIKALAQRINQKISISGRVVGVKGDGSYLVNVGQDDGVSAGTQVMVMRYGNTIIDPGTGEFLGREVTDLGLATVTAVDVGGSLSTVRPPKNAMLFKEGDRIVLVMGKGLLSVGQHTTRPSRSSEKSLMAKPIVFVSGLGLAIGGGGFTVWSLVQADLALAAYNNLGSNTAASVFTANYNTYKSTYDQILPCAVVGGVGVALIVTSLFLPRGEKTAWVVPTYDGSRFGLAAVARF